MRLLDVYIAEGVSELNTVPPIKACFALLWDIASADTAENSELVCRSIRNSYEMTRIVAKLNQITKDKQNSKEAVDLWMQMLMIFVKCNCSGYINDLNTPIIRSVL